MRLILSLLIIISFGFGILLFVGSLFLDPVLAWYEPIMCPAGSTLGTFKQDYSLPGESGTTVDLICTDANGVVTDVSDKGILFLFGGIALGVVLILVRASMGKKPRRDEEIIGEVM